MLRRILQVFMPAVFCLALCISPAHAQLLHTSPNGPRFQRVVNPWTVSRYPVAEIGRSAYARTSSPAVMWAQHSAPARFIHHSQARPLELARTAKTQTVAAAQKPGKVPRQPAGAYPQFDAPLYPVPRPDIPIQVGGTVLTNQAFSPFEMLHAHEYRSMYGPYYYRVKGHWFLTPFGIESHEKWELLGTKVRVKYRTYFGLLAKFAPPIVR